MKTAPHSSLPPFLLLHVPDAFLINGRRMDGLTEGPDNNGWSTGHKCSYWGDLWASAHRRLSSNRWDDFSKALDGRQPVRGKALSLVSEHHLLIRCFGWKPLQEVHPGKSLLAVNMTKTGEGKWNCRGKSVAWKESTLMVYNVMWLTPKHYRIRRVQRTWKKPQRKAKMYSCILIPCTH